MPGLQVDTDALDSTGARIAQTETSRPDVAVHPAADDAVSVAVARTLSARLTRIADYSRRATGIVVDAGAAVRSNAATYSATEQINAAALGSGRAPSSGAAPTLAPLPMSALDALSDSDTASAHAASATGVSPTDGRTIAQLIHGGRGPDALLTAAAGMRAHAGELRSNAAQLTSANATMAANWQSAASDVATERIGRLASWFDTHAGQADTAARAATEQADNFARTRAAVPPPEEFDRLERRLRVARKAAELWPALYSGAEIQAQLDLAEANRRAVTAYRQYQTMSAGIGGGIIAAPPNVTFKETPGSDDDGVKKATNMSSGDIEAIDRANRQMLQDMLDEYNDLPEGQVKQDRLADIQNIRDALKVPGSHLLYLEQPDDPSQMIAAATAVGDPFTADHVSVTVPGVQGDTRGTIEAMTREAAELRTQAAGMADNAKTSQNIATIAWCGYQPPLDMTQWSMTNDDLAQAGAPKLTSFLADLDAASHNPGQTTALFGHSYGSLLSGIALQEGASAYVDNAVLYGSPGFQATTTADLGMNDDNFFVMSAPDDHFINAIGDLAPLHGWGSAPNDIIASWNDDPRFRFPHLSTEAGDTPITDDGAKIGASGHSEYGREAQQRMSGYNLAAILLDAPELTVKETPGTWGQ